MWTTYWISNNYIAPFFDYKKLLWDGWTDELSSSSPPNFLCDHYNIQVIHTLNFNSPDLTSQKISSYRKFILGRTYKRTNRWIRTAKAKGILYIKIQVSRSYHSEDIVLTRFAPFNRNLQTQQWSKIGEILIHSFTFLLYDNGSKNIDWKISSEFTDFCNFFSNQGDNNRGELWLWFLRGEKYPFWFCIIADTTNKYKNLLKIDSLTESLPWYSIPIMKMIKNWFFTIIEMANYITECKMNAKRLHKSYTPNFFLILHDYIVKRVH